VTAAIEPERLGVAAGGSGAATVGVRNLGDLVEHVELSVEGQAAAWATVDPSVVRVMPGEDASATLQVSPPRSGAAPAGAYPLAVVVRRAGSLAVESQATAVVDVEAFELLEARIVPQRATRWRRSERRLELANQGNSTADLELVGTAPDDELRFARLPPRLPVAAGEGAVVRFVVRARHIHLVGRAVPRDFTVTARSAGGQEVTAAAVLRQRALLLLVLLVALVLLLLYVIAHSQGAL